MPEGDTIHRSADVLRRTIRDDEIVEARGRPGGAQLERVVGSRSKAVSARGKHLLVDLDNGLTLHTHMRMKGAWHRYRRGEPWRRARSRAVAVLETSTAVAVCFDAPTVELLDSRAIPIHPTLSQLGPDLLGDDFPLAEAVDRLRKSDASIAGALLDQRIVAGIGNVYRSEVLAFGLVDPILPAAELSEEAASGLLETARSLLLANADGGVRSTVPAARRGERWVYRRAGRPCRRCGTSIRSTSLGQPPRRVYWCPRCQA